MSDAFALPPYALGLGYEIDHMEGGLPVLACEFTRDLMGRPGFWHGGALGGMLEIAALGAVRTHLGAQGGRLKPVNVSIQFLRGGLAKRTYAVGHIVRAGRRLVNVTAEAWQEDRARLLATAQLQVMIGRANGE
jgi:acyl-coenzyme A thioesterase PaaI-like protein